MATYDHMLLIVDGEPMSVNRSALELSSETMKQWISSFITRYPDLALAIRLSLPDLDLPPFFNRNNVEIDPKAMFRRFYRYLIIAQSRDRDRILRLTDTYILASFAIFSDYLLANQVRLFVDLLLCNRYDRHLCDETFVFARKYGLELLYQKSLASLIYSQSYHIEELYDVSLQAVTDLMKPDFFCSVTNDPLTQIVKYAAKIDASTATIKSDIEEHHRSIVIPDRERFLHFVKWFEAIVQESFSIEMFRYALAVVDCLHIDDHSLCQLSVRMFNCLLIALQQKIHAPGCD